MDETTTQSTTAAETFRAAAEDLEPGDTISVEYTAASTGTDQETTGTVVTATVSRDDRLGRTNVTVEYDDADDDRHRVTAAVCDDTEDFDPTLHSVRYNWSNGERAGERGTHRVSHRGAATVTAEDDDQPVATDGGQVQQERDDDTDDDQADDDRPADLVRDFRRSRRPEICVPEVQPGDEIRVPEHVDGVLTVDDVGDAVTTLRGDGPEVTALVEGVDGSYAYVCPDGNLDVSRVEILEPDAVLEDDDQDDDADDVDLDAHPFDTDATHVDGRPEGAVEVVAVEDGQLVLAGDTYPAKDDIKRVAYDRRDWDGDRKVWLVDVDAVQDLHTYLNGAGFLLVDAREDADDADDDGEDLTVAAVAQDVAEGDRIRVEYLQKNGAGSNAKEGVVTVSDDGSDRVEPAVMFRRDDDQLMKLRPDDYGTLGLYTAGSHAPFVGDVQAVDVLED